MQQIVQWFDLGGEIQLSDTASAAEALPSLRGIQGLMEKTVKVGVGPKDSPEVQVSAAEFILEGSARAQAHRPKLKSASSLLGSSSTRIFNSAPNLRSTSTSIAPASGMTASQAFNSKVIDCALQFLRVEPSWAVCLAD